jgi:hypothetical protein
MKALHVSTATLMAAVGALVVAISAKDGTAVVAAIVAIVACFLPSVADWFKPKAAV